MPMATAQFVSDMDLHIAIWKHNINILSKQQGFAGQGASNSGKLKIDDALDGLKACQWPDRSTGLTHGCGRYGSWLKSTIGPGYCCSTCQPRNLTKCQNRHQANWMTQRAA